MTTGSEDYQPDRDIPDLSGKVIFITGGTGGIGKECILALVKHLPEHIYFSGRNAGSASNIISEVKASTPDVKLTFLECDLSSLKSVETVAKQFVAATDRLDILMLNAGVMALSTDLNIDGYELDFGTNHVGHALLTKLLLPVLLSTAQEAEADVRIVVLSSLAFQITPPGGIDFQSIRTVTYYGIFSQWKRYGQSKLANVLYAQELARRYPSITTVSIHPGVVRTSLVQNMSFFNKAMMYLTNIGKVKSPAEGAWNSLWGATIAKSNIINGAFYEPVGVPGRSSKYLLSRYVDDKKLAAELWVWTEKELSVYHA